MKREISDINILEKFSIEFSSVVERHCPYIIVSGFVAIALGRTRGTEDIDMIIPKLEQKKFFELHTDLRKSGFGCMQSERGEEVYGYLKEGLSVRYTWKDKPIPEMELKFSKDVLDEYQLKTRQKLPFTGTSLWFSSIEMNVAFKEAYLKSEKDLEDAKHLRMVYKGQLKEQEIENIKNMIRKRTL